jgi:hypothetical protein
MRPVIIWILFIQLAAGSCQSQDSPERRINLFTDYFKALSKNDGGQWQFTNDTVRLWFDEKSGNPQLLVRDQKKGLWASWDIEMNASSTYDSLWYDDMESAVKGYFYEDNDFYRLLKKPPTKTLRTYTFNAEDKISEILIYWIPEANKETTFYLEPVNAWALKNYPAEIEKIYPNGKLIPSKENAITWKKILVHYNFYTDSLQKK